MDRIKLTDTAETVLARRYYLKDENGNPVENWDQLCWRVARAVSSSEGIDRWDDAQAFYNMIYNLDFLPNSPCLMNAGTELGQLSACFVLPVGDSMEDIFTAVKNGALVHKTGGGTGYSFSRLRPKNSAVQSTQGVASGPLSFMEVFNTATETIKQGGKRRGANMAVLNVEHPDIVDFIKAKEDQTKFTNFNFSVGLTDLFMKQVEDGGEASNIFDLIVDRAWRTGEPGVLFLDEVNRANPTPWLGDIEASNPCGEQFLLPYESCNLGSINLGNFVRGGVLDKVRLISTVHMAVTFLDQVIDVTKYPIPEIEQMTKSTRKVGLGIMGLHDMLIQMELPYGSQEGRAVAAEVMQLINTAAHQVSEARARQLWPYPAALEEGADPYFIHRRNAALTSIQPTGTVSMIADCSSGCEPYFSIVMMKHVMDGDKLLMVNKHFERVARAEGFYSKALMEKVASSGTVVGHPEIPVKWQEIFRTAQDITPEDHILMQAVLQGNVDSGISKTINMPSTATREDVREAYLLAWKMGCKGLTVYRDGCRDNQVLNAGPAPDPIKQDGAVVTQPVKDELPDVLSAKRYRIRGASGESRYVIICFDEKEKPMEVFAKFPYDNRVDQVEKSVQWTVICRLVSLALRCKVPLEEIIKQLDRSSNSMNDLPAQLAKLFKTFLSTTSGGFRPPCPDCGAPLVFSEGCENCASCGFSKCS